ncbi:OLC1v1005122C1 [Oldenlandia corymbosa var. corymbosa]|uniref:OLC1v1005122C1 n=1 Tax=Oldenlandia corymbosa var. corymbosa TaxID=529605 RepID=A0AAV1DDW9_OLDCO|nr:OLC1v1005122C1 [Oldenlandia corymbosa var. corymbosa]
MEQKRLFDAAYTGDVATLFQLLEENLNLMYRSYLDCEDKNVLHFSAMLGNLEFVQATLHVFSCSSFSDMCFANDRYGRNPLHLAAINKRLNILHLVDDYDVMKQAALEKPQGGGTILHLSVKHNQLEAMKLLMQIFTHPKFVGAKDEDGMTILHLALENNQNQRGEIIMYLIENAAEIINIKNGNDKTAVDLFLEQARIPPRDLIMVRRNKRLFLKLESDEVIKDCFLRSKAQFGGDDIFDTEYLHHLLNSIDKSRDAIMIVASIIATMAFQLMANLPGGVWQDNLLEGPAPHQAGESVLAVTQPVVYRRLIWGNTVAFVSSLTIIMMMLGNGMSNRSRLPIIRLVILCAAMAVSVASISYTYALLSEPLVPEPARWGQSPNLLALIIVAIVMCIPMILPTSGVRTCYTFF